MVLSPTSLSQQESSHDLLPRLKGPAEGLDSVVCLQQSQILNRKRFQHVAVFVLLFFYALCKWRI